MLFEKKENSADHNWQSKFQELEKEVIKLRSVVEELSVLNDIAMAAGRATDVDNLLNLLVQKTVTAIKAEQGSILLVSPNEDSKLNTLIRKNAQSGMMPSYRLGNSITGWVLKNKQSLIIEDLKNDQRFRTNDEEKKSIRTVLCAPVWLKSEIIGLFNLTNKNNGESFTQGNLRLLSIIAAQSAQLIHNSQLQEEANEKKRLLNELELARSIQTSLLPSTFPKTDRLEVASYFVSADLVGGDYYDYIQIDENKFAVVIADVSGHGPSAAMIMTMLKGIVHSAALNLSSPSDAVILINKILCRTLPPDMFVTMIYLVIDTDNHKIFYTNAGHNYILLKKKGAVPNLIDNRNIALNLSLKARYDENEITYETDDLIVVYTDGLTEAVNTEYDMYGVDRLKDVLNKSSDKSTKEIIAEMQKDLSVFTEKEKQEDDVAVIAIKFKEGICSR